MSQEDQRNVLASVINMDWTVKAKYEIMTIVVDKFGTNTLLTLKPLILDICFEHMKYVRMRIKAIT